MREYITAVKEENEAQGDKDAGDLFSLDGVEIRYFKPLPGQFAMLMAQTGDFSTDDQKISAAINFFLAVLDPKSAAHVVGRLMDRDDEEFEMPLVTDIMEDMIEEWTGRPTSRSSASTNLQGTAGTESSATTPESGSSSLALTSS